MQSSRAFSCQVKQQRGALTLFTAILVLLLLSLMLMYASRTSVSEQQIAANDQRQKMAFHAAEAGLEQAAEYLFANNALITSSSEDVFTDGTDGWLAPGAGRWRLPGPGRWWRRRPAPPRGRPGAGGWPT